ncbi:tape measure protein [Furfurilactobacillus sp. WILCCON 0119]
MVKVQNEMATKIAIDTVSATSSMSGLTNAVRSGINAWKADEVALKSVGDSMGAAQAKFDGLGNVIDLQKKKIDELRTRQEGLDTANRQDAETYLKLQNQIDGATRQLASYEAQQNHSKQSLEYYTSGLSDLQRGYKMASEASEAHANRLIAEGHASDAEKEKLNGLNSAMKNLTEQQKLQETELEKIAHESGTSSEAYSRQKIRIDETAKAYAEAKSSAKSLEETISREPTTWFGKVSNGVKSLRGETEHAEKTTRSFRDVMTGTFVGGLASSGIQALTGKIHEAIQAGADFNKEQDTMKTVWHSLTTEAPRDGQVLIDYINKLGQSTIYSTDTINKMAQSFYHVHSNVTETKNWTNSFVALGSTLHMTNDALAESGEQFAKIVAGGKASQEDLNVMINRFPMFGEAIQKATGKSMKELQQMSSQGKLSAKEFEEALDYLGKKYKTGTTEAMTSYQGMSMYLSSRTSKLFGDIEKSSFSMSKSVKSDLLKLTSDKSMETYANGISAGISTMTAGATKALDYIAKHKDDLMGIAKSIATIAKLLFDGAWGVVSGTINAIGSAFGVMGGQSKKSQDPIKTLNKLLGGLAKHENVIKGVGGALVAAFATAKLMSGVTALAKGIGAVTAGIKGVKTAEEAQIITQQALNVAMKANVFIAIASAVIALGVALFELYKHNKKFRDFVNGIGKVVKNVFKGIVKVVGNAFKTIGKLFTGDLGWEKAISKQLSNVGKSFQKGWKSFTNVVGKLFKGLGKAMIIAIAFPVGLAMILLKPLVKIFSNVISEIGKWWSKNISKPFEDGFKKVGKSVGGWWSSNISKPVGKGLGDIGHSISDGWNSWNKTQASWAKPMAKYWQSHWDNMNKYLGSKWNDMSSTTGKWYDNTNKSFGNWSSNFKKSWGTHWDNTRNSLSDHWNDMYNNSDVFGKSLHGWLDTFTSTFQKNWKGFGDALGDIWNSAWKSIKNIAHDAMKGVVDIINTGINGIDDVIHLFGGDAKAISPIKFANGTANGRVTHNMIAMLNDGHDSPETGNKEMIVKADGRKQIVQGQDVLAPLEAGDAVVKASDTRDYMYAQGVYHFADGTGLGDSIKSSVGGAANWVGDKVGDVEKWIGDKTKAVTEFFKNPVKKVTEVFDHYISGFKKMTPFTSAFAPSGGHYIIKQGEKWFKNLFDKLNEDLSAPAGSGVERWRDQVKKALEMNGLSTDDSMVNRVLRQIQTESGGNEKAKQPGADPDGDGSGPALGLMQTKMATFLANAFPNHKNWQNGFDDILAGLNYAKKRYGNNLSFLGNGHGYANGGFVSQNQLIEVAEGNKKEAIIPMDITKRSRANQLLMEVLGMFASEDQQNDYQGSKERNDGANQDTAVVKLMQKNNTLLEQNNTLTNTLISIVSALGIDMPSLANHMSNYQALRDFQGS